MSRLLLESGDLLLLESGDGLLLEVGAAPAVGMATETDTAFTPTSPSAGSHLLLESGDILLLESGSGLLLEISDYFLSSPTVTGTTTDGGTAVVTFSFSPGGSGTLYYVVGPAIGWRNPSPVEVVAGQLYGGIAADYSANATPPINSGVWSASTPITGLIEDGEYRVAFVYLVMGDYSNVAVSNVWSATASTTTGGRSPAIRLLPWLL